MSISTEEYKGKQESLERKVIGEEQKRKNEIATAAVRDALIYTQ